MKNFILFAAFCLFTSNTGALALTYETCEECLSCGTNCKYTLINGKMTVYGPSEKNSDGTYINEGQIARLQFQNNTEITDLEVTGNITHIGYFAFNNATSLQTVKLTDNLKTMESNIFNGATNLSSVDFGQNPQITNFGGAAFKNTNLQSITIPDSVTTLVEDFSGVPLKNIEFGENSHLTNISSLGSSQIESIKIPDSVTTIGVGGFTYNQYLKSVEFGENSQLTTISDGAFTAAYNFQSIKIPEGVTTIGKQAFRFTKVSDFVVPESVTTIGEYAFGNISSLKSLIVEGILDENTSSAAFIEIASNVKIYCKINANCENKGASTNQIKIYENDKSGAYFVDGEYYATADDLINQTKCEGGLTQNCIQKALEEKAKKLKAKKTVCSDDVECLNLVIKDYNGEVIQVGSRSYASLADLFAGKHIPKRIYTIEEAEKLSQKTGNTFRVRYK